MSNKKDLDKRNSALERVRATFNAFQKQMGALAAAFEDCARRFSELRYDLSHLEVHSDDATKRVRDLIFNTHKDSPMYRDWMREMQLSEHRARGIGRPFDPDSMIRDLGCKLCSAFIYHDNVDWDKLAKELHAVPHESLC